MVRPSTERRRNAKPPTGYARRVVDGLSLGPKYKPIYEGVHYDERAPYPLPLPLPVKEELRPVDPRPPRLTLSELECIDVLGEGTFGRVFLMRTRGQTASRGAKLFAMKALPKKQLRSLDDGYMPSWKNRERDLLASAEWHPFVTGILDAFYDARHAYMLLEYSPCGTLADLIAHRGLPPARAQFYLANIVCALAFLHTRCGAVHRDLKPENILVRPDGYLALCDFGPAVRVPAAGIIAGSEPLWVGEGTITHAAPELLLPEGQAPGTRLGRSVDWWSVGAILFEMVTGEPPFPPTEEPDVPFDDAAGVLEVWALIQAGPPVWPPAVRAGMHLKALVGGLLTRDVERRFGLREVMRHPWLAAVDWVKMRGKRYLPPTLGRPPAARLAHKPKRPVNPTHYPGIHFALDEHTHPALP